MKEPSENASTRAETEGKGARDLNTATNVRKATLLWMIALLSSRLMGFLREIVIARQAGANADTDVYFAAYTIPDFVNYLLAGGALSITFIPIFSAYLSRGDEDEGWHVFSIVTTFLAIVLGALIASAMYYTPELTPWVAKGFDDAQRIKLVRMTRIVLPAQFFIFEGFLLSAVQMAKGLHRYAALAPLLYGGGTILGGLLLGDTLGMEGFAWGTLGGAVVGSFGLQLYGARRVGLRWRPALSLRHPGFISYFKLSLPIMIGQSLIAWDEWIMRYFGSFLTAATISWLNYGRKLAMVPVAVFGNATGFGAYPYLARCAAEGRAADVQIELDKALRSVLLLALMTQVILFGAAEDIVSMLFRNATFSRADVEATARALQVFSLGIAAWSSQGVVARGLYAFRDTLTPTAIGTVMTILALPLYGALAFRFQYVGLAAASTLALSAYTVILSMLFNRRIRIEAPAHRRRPFSPFLARVVGACIVATLCARLVRDGLGALVGDGRFATMVLMPFLGSHPDQSHPFLLEWVRSLFVVIGVTGVATPVFVGLCLLFRVDEIKVLAVRVGGRIPVVRGYLSRGGVVPGESPPEDGHA